MGELSAAPPWHTRTADATLQALDSSNSGLDAAEASLRLTRWGRNELPQGEGRSPWRMLVAQFSDPLIFVLLAAALISGWVGEPVDTLAIVVIIALNAVIGLWQEWRAERALAALRRLAAPSAHARREQEVLTVPAAELVPGDIVLLEAGNVVPADLRLLEVAQLQIAEAALTGESQPVAKRVEALTAAELPLGDRCNMAWKGTLVTQGRAVGVIVATGLATELGRIARLLSAAEEVKTPLQKRLARFATRLAWVVLAICAVVFFAGLARGEPPALMFLTAVSLAVAAIPEALPAVVAIALALGAARLVKQNALIRRLPAVETLGSITYICTDKTGTLTLNRMRAEAFFVAGESAREEENQRLWRCLALVNDAQRDAAGAWVGDPTEVALAQAAGEHGCARHVLLPAWPRVGEFPFDAQRKRMSTQHRRPSSEQTASSEPAPLLIAVKGAPETMLPICSWQRSGARLVPLQREAVLARAEEMAAQGLRVLAFAEREADALVPSAEIAESDLIFLGLVGLLDPPRDEAAQAVAECRTAGIVPVMITGDHPATARAIAARLGILEEGGQVMTGAELARLSEADLAARVKTIRVYARVDPEQKIRIVRALQAAGEFAAMTGDGVNDAPALKAADIGVAMGQGGTDVAREASHLVLLDDNFASIVRAVREGRRIYDNVRKFIKYTMTSNSGEIAVIFFAPFLGLPIPLLPIHILWINLVTDGLPGLALAAEPAERNLMRRPPRRPEESIFAHGLWQHMVWVGLTMAAVCLVLQSWALGREGAHWQTMVFTVLCLSQLGHALAIRSERFSTFSIGFGSNPYLMFTVLATLGLQLATIYVPVLNPIFKTTALELDELLLCLVLSTGVFFAVELEKFLVRRGWIYRR